MKTAISDEVLALMRSLVLHVATGSPLTDDERQAVRTMATLLGAKLDDQPPPIDLLAKDERGGVVECNAESEMDLMQLGTAVWLVCHIIGLSGDVDRRRRRVARELVEFFEQRKVPLGLDVNTSVLVHFLRQVPQARTAERSTFLSGVWVPTFFLRTRPDFDHLTLDRIFASPRSRLTVYKLCHWFAVASGRRSAAVIDCLAGIRSELHLDSDPRCLAISSAVVVAIGSLPAAALDPVRTAPMVASLAEWVVQGGDSGDGPEAFIWAIPEEERLSALCHVFDVALRETGLSNAALGCLARVVDAMEPPATDLTAVLQRFELDCGRRIRLPRAYILDYGKPGVLKRAM